MQDSISGHGTVLDNAAGMGQWWIVVVNIGQCWTVQQAWDSVILFPFFGAGGLGVFFGTAFKFVRALGFVALPFAMTCEC